MANIKVPYLDLKAQYRSFKVEIDEAIRFEGMAHLPRSPRAHHGRQTRSWNVAANILRRIRRTVLQARHHERHARVKRMRKKLAELQDMAWDGCNYYQRQYLSS